MTEERKIERGQVYFLREDDSVGAELSIGRPVLVLNNQELIDKLPTVIVAYMTTTPQKHNSTVKVFTGRKYSYVILNQIRTIDKRRLNEFMCTLTSKEMERIDTALSYVFSIGEFLEDEVVEEPKIEISNSTDELASLKMELALHKALYEKTLEKLIELRLEKDGVTEKVEAPKPKVVEQPKDVWADEPQLDLSALEEKFNMYDQRLKQKKTQESKKVIPQAPLDYDGPIGNARLINIGRKLNINTATYDDFRSIGMGDGVSKKIVRYRNKYGKFSCLEELLNVPGFGKGSYVVYTPGLTV